MLERRRVLVLACDRQLALRYKSALQVVGFDVATVSSSTDLNRHFDWRQFAAIVMANSFHEPEKSLFALVELLNNRAPTPDLTLK